MRTIGIGTITWYLRLGWHLHCKLQGTYTYTYKCTKCSKKDGNSYHWSIVAEGRPIKLHWSRSCSNTNQQKLPLKWVWTVINVRSSEYQSWRLPRYVVHVHIQLISAHFKHENDLRNGTSCALRGDCNAMAAVRLMNDCSLTLPITLTVSVNGEVCLSLSTSSSVVKSSCCLVVIWNRVKFSSDLLSGLTVTIITAQGRTESGWGQTGLLSRWKSVPLQSPSFQQLWADQLVHFALRVGMGDQV